jgi:hypothetical protein
MVFIYAVFHQYARLCRRIAMSGALRSLGQGHVFHVAVTVAYSGLQVADPWVPALPEAGLPWQSQTVFQCRAHVKTECIWRFHKRLIY